MSLNVSPHIPQVVVNAATPSTEALARSNAIREVVPATGQAEAIVPQKSREQDVRGPNSATIDTYDDIQQQQQDKNQVISEQDQEGEQEPQQQASDQQQQDNSEQEANEAQVEKQERQEQQQITQLEQRHQEVVSHEQAHAAIGGIHAGAPSYQYQTGPDGKKYAVGGEVSIDVSKEASPEATIRKMQQVMAAALAPAEPSAQDRKVAAQAAQHIAEAKSEMAIQGPPKPSVKTDKADSEPNQAVSIESESEQQQDSVSAQQVAKVVLARYHSSYQMNSANLQVAV